MWIGNLMLVVLNLPLIGIWVRLLRSLPAAVSVDPGVLRDRRLQRQYRECTFSSLASPCPAIPDQARCEGAPLFFGFILGR